MTRIVSRPHAAAAQPERLSYQDFLRAYSDNDHVEWVDGEVIEMAAVTIDHEGVNGFLYSTMKVMAEERKLGRVLKEPFQMKTGDDLPGRAPDVMFVANKNLKRLHTLYLEGPADLVIEIVSPSSRTTDRVHKFREYETGGVPEYWIIDQEMERAEFYRLGRSGRYTEVTPKDGVIQSRSMKGFWVRIDWLWSPPPLLAAMRELGLVK